MKDEAHNLTEEEFNIEEITQKEKEIYPICEGAVKSDQEIDKLHNIKNWSEMFYHNKTKLVKERFLKVISNSEYSKFFEALDYEYGINGKSQDIQKAFEIYKHQANNSTDILSMYKMSYIYKKEFIKFNLSERNKILEKYYLFKCFSYSPNHQIEKNSSLLNRFFVPIEVKMHIFYEDVNMLKFDELIKHLNKYYNYYKINKDDIKLIEAVMLFEYKSGNLYRIKAFQLLKELIDKNNLEALYKTGIFAMKGGLKSDKFFDVLYHEDYYRSYCDYAIFLYKEKKDYKLALKILKEASMKGILRANYLYYDIYLNLFDFSKVVINKEFKDDLLFLFDRLINDMVTDGVYSYFEFFYLRRLCIKLWNLKDFFDTNFNSFTKDFMVILISNTCSSLAEEEIKSKKELLDGLYLRNDFYSELHLSCGIIYYYGIENILDINLKKSLIKFQISFDNSNSKSYKRFCYSYISRIKQKLYNIDNKLISNSENEEAKKTLFDLYNTSIKKETLNILSSSFFYYLSRLYKKKWGNPGNEIMEYIFLKRASQSLVLMPGTGTIISYYRKYKSIVDLDKNWGNYIIQLTMIKDSEGYGEDNSLCPICMENKRDTIFLPCKHLFCNYCAKKIMEKAECPICRGIIIINLDIQHVQDNSGENEKK